MVPTLQPRLERVAIMLAPEVHKILREVLGPEMKRLGFRRLSGSNAGWYRAGPPRYLLVYAYISWIGFNEQYGNWFALEFAYANEPKMSSILSPVRRDGELLTGRQMSELALIEDQARAAIPALKPTGEFSSMLYYYPQHVRAYAQILAGAMESMLEAFQKSGR